MGKNVQRNGRSSPDGGERGEEYWNDGHAGVNPTWDARKAGRHKSKSKGKERGARRRPMTESEENDFLDESDLQ